jgi:hypothetical protein
VDVPQGGRQRHRRLDMAGASAEVRPGEALAAWLLSAQWPGPYRLTEGRHRSPDSRTSPRCTAR